MTMALAVVLTVVAPVERGEEDGIHGLVPTLTLEQAYDAYGSGGTTGWEGTPTTRLDLGFTARATPPRNDLRATYRLGGDIADRRLLDSQEPGAVIAWRHALSTDLRHRASDRLTLAAGGSYLDTPASLDTPDVVAFQSNRVRTVHAELSPRVVYRASRRQTTTAVYRYSRDDVAGFGFTAHRFEVGVDTRLTPVSNLETGIRVEAYDFDDDGDERAVVIPLTWGVQFAEPFGLKLSIGPRASRPDNGSWQVRSPDVGATLEARRPAWRSALSLGRSTGALPGLAGLRDTVWASLTLGGRGNGTVGSILELTYLGIDVPSAHGVGATVNVTWRLSDAVEGYAGYGMGYQSFVVEDGALARREGTYRILARLGLRVGWRELQ